MSKSFSENIFENKVVFAIPVVFVALFSFFFLLNIVGLNDFILLFFNWTDQLFIVAFITFLLSIPAFLLFKINKEDMNFQNLFSTSLIALAFLFVFSELTSGVLNIQPDKIKFEEEQNFIVTETYSESEEEDYTHCEFDNEQYNISYQTITTNNPNFQCPVNFGENEYLTKLVLKGSTLNLFSQYYLCDLEESNEECTKVNNIDVK
jgi:hypothetical protein